MFSHLHINFIHFLCLYKTISYVFCSSDRCFKNLMLFLKIFPEFFLEKLEKKLKNDKKNSDERIRG